MKNIANIILCLTLFSCYNQDDYSIKNISDLTVIDKIAFSKASLLANGKDSLLLQIKFNDKTDPELSEVSIETTKGIWLGVEGNTVKGTPSVNLLDDQPCIVFEAVLQAGNSAGLSALRIKVGNISKDTTVNFFTNPPTSIFVIPSSLTSKNDLTSELEVTVSLTSSNGAVSSKYPFSLMAIDTSDNEIGTFRIKQENCQSNVCISNFSMVPDTTYVGEIKLVATANSIETSKIIYITD